MRIKKLSLLIAIAVNLLGVQQANAEQQPNVYANNLPAPIWVNEQVPIAWADCVPVPVMPLQPPMPPVNSNVMGMAPFSSNMLPPPIPFPNQGTGMPMVPQNQPPILLPPPSPFFAPVNLDEPYQASCATSKDKVAELQQALDDIQNQMADSRGIIEDLEAKLTSNTKSQDTAALNESETKFKVLQNAYEQQHNSYLELKEKIAKIKAEKQELAVQLEELKKQDNLKLTEKLGLLDQKTKGLKQLKIEQQHQNITIYELEKKLEASEQSKNELKDKLSKLKEETGKQTEKFGILSQTATKYKVLTDYEKALNVLKNVNFPVVLKTDGLAMGKGTLIAENFHEAEQFRFIFKLFVISKEIVFFEILFFRI